MTTQTLRPTAPPQLPASHDGTRSLGGLWIGSPQKRQGLVYSLFDGILANGMLALMETFTIAAAVFLNAPAIALGLIGSLPLLLSSVGQLLLPRVVDEARGRRHYVVLGALGQGVFLWSLAFTGFLPERIRPWAFVAVFALYGFSGNVVSGFWMAWMGELVPSEVRGRHFAWRNRLFSVTQLGFALVAGLVLRRYSAANSTWTLFSVVFLIAGALRFASGRMLSLQYEPALSSPKSSALPTRGISGNFLFYSISIALMQGAVALSGPFFNVWFVRDLRFDFFALSTATAATVLGTLISLPIWGRLTDSIGNRRIILLTGFMISVVPLPYVIASLPWHIWMLNFYTGVCWSGYNLSNFNYLLAASGKHNPERRISLAVAISGFSIFLFSVFGGFLAPRLPVLFSWQLQSLFLLSAVLRLSCFGAFFWRFPQHQTPTGSSAEEVFSRVPGYRAGPGILRNAFRAFRSK